VLSLAQFLIDKRFRALGRAVPEIEPRAGAALMAHAWPGNVRELENEIERALALSGGGTISLEHLSERVRGASSGAPLLGGDFTLAEIEREHIQRVVTRARSLEAAAEILGIDDSTLWRKRKRFAENGLRSVPPRSAA
jgi:NtrC-family two-component system response regulator AlgB